MNALGKGYFFIAQESGLDSDLRKAEAWRQLHQRPDALPLPPEPARVGFTARIIGKVSVFRLGGRWIA
jgi:hypothetical protein